MMMMMTMMMMMAMKLMMMMNVMAMRGMIKMKIWVDSYVGLKYGGSEIVWDRAVLSRVRFCMSSVSFVIQR